MDDVPSETVVRVEDVVLPVTQGRVRVPETRPDGPSRLEVSGTPVVHEGPLQSRVPQWRPVVPLRFRVPDRSHRWPGVSF